MAAIKFLINLFPSGMRRRHWEGAKPGFLSSQLDLNSQRPLCGLWTYNNAHHVRIPNAHEGHFLSVNPAHASNLKTARPPWGGSSDSEGRADGKSAMNQTNHDQEDARSVHGKSSTIVASKPNSFGGFTVEHPASETTLRPEVSAAHPIGPWVTDLACARQSQNNSAKTCV